MVSAGALEEHDYDVLTKLLPDDGSVRLDKVTTQFGVLVLAGPQSRAVMQKVADVDMSNKAFPWLTAQTVSIGAAGCQALRVNFEGELGWELHHPIEMQNYIFDTVMAAGKEFGIRPFGLRAMDSLRLEKSYKLVGRELSIEYAALESGLDRFIDAKKNDFLGHAALMARKAAGFKNTAVTMEVHGVTDADARGSEPVYQGDTIVGRTTSGGYGWRVGKSLALAMVSPALSAPGTELKIAILGERRRVTIVPESPFDPENLVLRG
jgi:dimethylglycine dehydrogenase